MLYICLNWVLEGWKEGNEVFVQKLKSVPKKLSVPAPVVKRSAWNEVGCGEVKNPDNLGQISHWMGN